jgi:hypothetical protein
VILRDQYIIFFYQVIAADPHLHGRVSVYKGTNTAAMNFWYNTYLKPAWRKWKEQFLDPENRPKARLILLMDRAPFHVSFAGETWGGHKEADIYTAFVPANATYLLQPVDRSKINLELKRIVRQSSMKETQNWLERIKIGRHAAI